MERKHTFVYGIKGKLVSAVAMLLVAVIMVVSSTYAWFTLSTAPEVTGISTNIGANGALEMALWDGVEVLEGMVGTDTAVNVKNKYWGNLVDLSDPQFYGWDKITLYPSTLAANANSGIVVDALGNPVSFGSTILSTPVYGADGRPIELEANGILGKYGTDSFVPSTSLIDGMGFRVVGVASGMTDRQLAYQNALSAAGNAKAQALSMATNSMKANGSAIANVAVKKATGGTEYTKAEVEALIALINDLVGTDGNGGVIATIETAYRNYIIAYAASDLVEVSATGDLVYKNIGLTWSNSAYTITLTGGTVPTELSALMQEPLNKLAITKANVLSAQTTLNTLLSSFTDSDTTCEWNDLSPALTKIVDAENMEINGIKANVLKDNMSELVNKVASEGLNVTINTGAGVYADIADHCGKYEADIKIDKISYGGSTIENMSAKMKAETTVNPTYLTAISNQFGTNSETLPDRPSKGGDEAAAMPISEFYGYIMDLAFRTNATSSNLLLQITPKDRIYDDNNNENAETWGHGSTMTFTKTSNELTDDQLLKLIQAFRIVFFTPAADATGSNNVVVATAMLDVKYTTDGEGKVTLETQEDGSVVASLYLYKYVADENDATKGVVARQGEEGDETYKLMPLQQSAQTNLSVLVYLEGNNIGNSDVLAQASSSMTAALNLQFSSDANLVPMDYAEFQNETTTAAPTNP